MSLLTTLQTQGSVLSNLNGAQGPQPNFAGSKLHFEYSINNNPIVPGKPAPSQLDLEGVVPAYNYRDNAPENRTF
jgi:hypothetical protein